MTTRLNIENCARQADKGGLKWMADTLVENLKELRDRCDAGDYAALDEFFDVFRFNDSQQTGQRPNIHAQRYAMGLKHGQALHDVAHALGVKVGQDVTVATLEAAKALMVIAAGTRSAA